mmetsp:Transcript_23202/g.54823  ORF Transcript_23202/g.54823 Transcript_23202/m.54823 type:complete len:157 (+) Transcript_23202:709-1179(+)
MSSSCLRSSSMRRACAGRTSAMCSGSSQAEDMGEGRRLKTALYRRPPRPSARRRFASAQQQQCDQADADAGQPDETDLAIAEGQHAAEQLAPLPRADQGQQPLDHQHQRAGRQQLIHLRAGEGAGALPEPEPRMALKKSLFGSTTITSLLLRKLAR